MKIINLIEDTKGSADCLYEHGLSFYIETPNHKLLVDTGASDAFIRNARTLNIDLSAVDTVFISHGHYDHAGGLLDFLAINNTAVVYIQESANGEFYNASTAGGKYIGMDRLIASNPQVRFMQGDLVIDDELSIFADVVGRRLWPKTNELLKRKVVTESGEEKLIQDEFEHEQYLVVEAEGERLLLSGCAHNGILNILDKYLDMYDDIPTKVISGFHMTKKEPYTDEDDIVIKATARELSELDTTFYTGHCTGAYPLELMQSIMGEQLKAIHSGEEII